MLKRDVTRLEDCLERLDECPLGSGALAGTTYPIDRHQTAQALGFAAPMENSWTGFPTGITPWSFSATFPF